MRDEKLQQVVFLTRMLAAVRRAYLDVHARIPPVTRQVGRALDTTNVDTWTDIKYFTNSERDQIDVQAQNILARCADCVHDMETLEKRAPPPSSLSNTLWRLLNLSVHRPRGARRSTF
jgi:syntaxin 18